MNCNNCGNNLKGNENYCPGCGKRIDSKMPIDEFSKTSTENYRTASIVLGGLSLGGVVLFVLAPVSLILSIIGLICAIKSNKNSKNTVGLVLNGIGLFLSFIITSIIALFLYLAVDIVKDGIDGTNFYDYIEERRVPTEEDRF